MQKKVASYYGVAIIREIRLWVRPAASGQGNRDADMGEIQMHYTALLAQGEASSGGQQMMTMLLS
jgi:hypothetical protein